MMFAQIGTIFDHAFVEQERRYLAPPEPPPRTVELLERKADLSDVRDDIDRQIEAIDDELEERGYVL